MKIPKTACFLSSIELINLMRDEWYSRLAIKAST